MFVNKPIVVTALLVALVRLGFAQGTLIHRVDMSRGSEPYHVTAVISDSGWELWAFGSTRHELLDLEMGRLFPVEKNLLVGGYAIYWPASGEWFVAPALSYNQSLLGGQLSVFALIYVPLNNGPRISLVDDASLTWSSGKVRYGLAANYFKFGDDPASLRLGPTVRLPLGETTNIKLGYQPLYLAGQGKPSWRVELSQRF